MTTTPHGQVPAIQRYKIGYHSDEWGVRSSTPGGIYDDAGQWVRYEDHAAVITTLRAQQPAPAGARYEIVAYLDVGAGGYLDLEAALSEDALQQLPKGRHALVIAGTWGINGYVAAPQPAPATQQAGEMPESIEQLAVARYKVVPAHESMFHRWAVVAGDGAQQLYLGREVECENMARKFSGAFLDGAFVALQNAAPQPSPTAQAAESVPAADASPSAASIAWNALRDMTDPLGEVGVKIMGSVRIYAQRQYEAGLAARVPAEIVGRDALTVADAELLQKAITDFEECGETDVPDKALQRFAAMGYLECVHYNVLPAAQEAIDAARAQAAKEGGAP